ncbi:AIPR family protein [Leuconostoc mesenteroides]|uniref:AIPR family protein n=1 Tax=Leuconostoc mesenteroides TaxID=1245 RepID=UPI0023616B58|nr:AIPR family protein [Leuconostoc mesenteroides]
MGVAYNNSLKLVDIELKKFRKQLEDSDFNNDEVFEYFVTDNFLKEKNLSLPDIESGLVGGTNDWGVDGIFLFLNDQQIYIPDDYDVTDDNSANIYSILDLEVQKKKSNMEVFIFQFKHKDKIEESVINKLNSFSDTLLNLNIDYTELSQKNSIDQNLLKYISVFQKIILAGDLNVSVHNIHASLGNTSSIQESYHAKVRILEEKYNSSTLVDNYDFQPIGASELQKITNVEVITPTKLVAKSAPISSEFGADSENIGYIATINIGDYFNFITLKNTEHVIKLNEKMFDANIRDFMNRSSINQQIEETVKSGAIKPMEEVKADFWWLNNGITLLADEGNLRGQSFTLENVQIVNGLQTSYSIYRALKDVDERERERDKHSVFVKIIITTDSEIRDDIIKSTNSQNKVSPSSLRATDPVQRGIENYLKEKGYYYDRRKNYYRNKGKKVAKIFDTNYLVQALVSILQQKPSKAKSNPTILIKTDEEYQALFASDFELDAYYAAVRIRKEVELLLKSIEYNTSSSLIDDVKKYYSLHVVWIVSAILTGNPKPNSKNLSNLVKKDELIIDDNIVKRAVEITESAITDYQTTHGKKPSADIAKLEAINSLILDSLQSVKK